LDSRASHWDSLSFGSIGEAVTNQIPVSIELPTNAFSRQNQGNLFQVGHPQRMAAMFSADPLLEILGEFTNFDAGTELIELQNMVPIPHRYTHHFIAGHLTPCQAWEIVGNEIMTHGNQVACAPLMNLLRLACTQHQAGDTASILAHEALDVPMLDAALIQHRTEIIAHKLPGLNSTPTLAAGQQVA
jgi:hypothetical protein